MNRRFIKLTIGFGIIFSLLFLIYPTRKLEWVLNYQGIWIWNKQGFFGTKPYPGLEPPKKFISGYKWEGGFYSFFSGKYYKSEEDKKIEYALLEPGFLEYKKIGDQILFYDGNKEILWKKNYSSYPRPGYRLNIIPLVSGDGNAVFLIDRNGNPISPGMVEGNFVTDICYSNDFIFILFGGGEYYLINSNKGLIIQNKIQTTPNQPYFAKSCAISPNGEFYAIHYQDGNQDKIAILSSEGEKRVYHSEKITTHKLHMAINHFGILGIIFSQKAIFLDKKAREITNIPGEFNEYFNPIVALGNKFLIGTKKKFYVVNDKGKILYENSIYAEYYRFIPLDSGNFFIETDKDIRYYFNFDLNYLVNGK